MGPNDPDSIFEFDFDSNAHASSMTHLSYSHDVSPPHSPSLHEHTYTPQEDAEVDAIRTVPSSRPALHNLRIPTSSRAISDTASVREGAYKAFVPLTTPKSKTARGPIPPLININSNSNRHREERPSANRDLNQDVSLLDLQKQIRNLLALIVVLLVIIIAMLIPLIYLTARTWIFSSHNASAFAADGQGISRGLPGLVADIVTRAANATRAEIVDPVNALGGWSQDMSAWANATTAKLDGMDAGGLNNMVRSAVGGVDGVNKRFDGLLEKLVVIGVNGTGEIWDR